MNKETEFKVNHAENQFEMHSGKSFAFLEYVEKDNKIYLLHTEAPDELQGTGIAKQLVKAALEYSRKNNLTVVPSCSYVAHYLNNHPEWRDVLSEGYQM